MSQLCFATYARALQERLIQPPATCRTRTRQGAKQPSKARPKMTSTDTYVVEALLSWIQKFAPVEDREGWDVWRSSKTVSDLLKQKIELHTGFGTILKNPKLPEAAREAFEVIARDIAPLRKADFKTNLVKLIKEDPEISPEATEELLNMADTDEICFYATTFLSAISRSNKKRDDHGSVTEADVVLAARNGDLCPLCRKERLFKTIKGERLPFFDIVTFNIDDQSDETDREAVCAKCAKIASTEETLLAEPSTVTKLRALRDRRIATDMLQETALDAQLHPAISDVIENLGERIESGEVPPLKMDAVRVVDKIRPEFFVLAGHIKFHVLQWYRYVEKEFRDLEGSKRRSRFDNIAGQVADFYNEARKCTDDQQLIFDQVVDWIHVNSKSTNFNASVIVACFFVQNCEVFDAVA